RVLGEVARVHGVLDVLVTDQRAVQVLRDPDLEALRRVAVELADDDILRDVDETTSQVPGVRGAKRRVRKTLARTVRGDEVLRDGEALLVGVDDRTRDDVTLRVRHQTPHTGDLPDLHPVASRPGRHHAVDVVVRREVRLHRVGDLGGRLVPDL